jgi:hypothetical protein
LPETYARVSEVLVLRMMSPLPRTLANVLFVPSP